MRILFVCMGNVCRSAIAERLATTWAREKLAHSPEADMVEVGSAGLSAVAGRPIDPHSAAALVELGGNPADLLQRADLTGLAFLPLTQRARELGRRLDAARAGRTRADGDDIADPIGQDEAVHREVADRVATALRPLADVLFTSVRSDLPAPVPV